MFIIVALIAIWAETTEKRIPSEEEKILFLFQLIELLVVVASDRDTDLQGMLQEKNTHHTCKKIVGF